MRNDRNIDLIDETNDALLDRIEQAFDGLDDDEFIEVLYGFRGNLSFLQNSSGSFKLCDVRCICGSIDNCKCQWLEKSKKCQGAFCEHFHMRIVSSIHNPEWDTPCPYCCGPSGKVVCEQNEFVCNICDHRWEATSSDRRKKEEP